MSCQQERVGAHRHSPHHSVARHPEGSTLSLQFSLADLIELLAQVQKHVLRRQVIYRRPRHHGRIAGHRKADAGVLDARSGQLDGPVHGCALGGIHDGGVLHLNIDVQATRRHIVDGHLLGDEVYVILQRQQVQSSPDAGGSNQVLRVEGHVVQAHLLHADATAEDTRERQIHDGLARCHHRVALGIEHREALQTQIHNRAQAQTLYTDIQPRRLGGILRSLPHSVVLHGRNIEKNGEQEQQPDGNCHDDSGPLEEAFHLILMLFECKSSFFFPRVA